MMADWRRFHVLGLLIALHICRMAIAGADVPPPAGPHPAKADGTATPGGAYVVARMVLEKGWGGQDVQVLLGLRDGKATTAWVAHNACPWIREIRITLDAGRLKGGIKGGAAEGDIWLQYALDAAVEGGRLAGTYTGRLQDQEATGALRGEIRDEPQMARDHALPMGKNWPCWYGVSSGLRGPDGGRAMIEHLSDARPVWKSEAMAGSAYGNAPDNRYGPTAPVKSNIGSGASSPVVADGRVYWYYYVPSGEVDEKGMWLKMWREAWEKSSKGQPFPSKAIDFHRPAADDVIVCMDAATGKTLWKTTFVQRNVNIQTHKHRGFNPTPLVADGAVYVGNYASCFSALDAKTGKALWRYDQAKTSPPRTVGPVLADGVLVVAGAKVVGLEPKTGRERWTAAYGAAGPLIPWSDGKATLVLVPVRTDARGTETPTTIVALDAATGKDRWKAPVKFGNNDWHPLMENGYLVGWSGVSAGSGVAQITGTLHCYRIKPDGLEPAWEGPGPNPVDDYYAMSIARGILYVAGFKECWSMDLATGKRLGAVAEVGGKSTLYLYYADGRIISSPEGRHGNQGFVMVDARDPANLVKLVSPSMAEQSVVHIKGAWHPLHAETCAYANHPVISPLVDGRRFVRGRDAIYCYDLRRESQRP